MTGDTVLLRQVHPNFMNEAVRQPTSQAFMPFPKDDGKLSVYDGDLISPENSYLHYTETLGNKSESVWGVTETEVKAENLSAASSPQDNFLEHADIIFPCLSEKDSRKKAKKLASYAIQRKQLYPPTT